MQIILPSAVSSAIQQLNNAGYEAYAVGGCVRDSLMGIAPKDWDITTSATPAEMQTVFADSRTIETGLKHGTLTVIKEGLPLEITTYRVDGDYSDGRHPDSVAFTGCLADDLQRRDFAINAMAYHPNIGVVDLYGGQEDISDGLISCVGEAKKRFSEDALRILRALRFASVLGFAITKETELAIRALYPTLSCVSVERITTEVTKLLSGTSAQRILIDYPEVFRHILPEIEGTHEYSLLSRVPATPIARWTALFYACDLSAEKAGGILRRLRLDNRSIRAAHTLISCRHMPLQTDADLLRLLNRLDNTDLLRDYMALNELDVDTCQRIVNVVADRRCYKVSMLAISGDDIVACGVRGPDVGVMLEALLNAVMDGKCTNEKKALLQYMQTLKKPVQ